MMKIIKILSSVIILSLFANSSLSAKKEKDVPPWMEDVKVKGRSTYLVPKGAKREIIGSQVVVEPPNEYVARRMHEIEQYLEEQFKNIEDDRNDLKKDIEELKEALKGIENKLEEDKVASSE